MTKEDEKQLKLEIEHIFNSGANEVRVFNMVKSFIERRYYTPQDAVESFDQRLQNDFGASDYDMMMIFGTDARTQADYLRDNPQFRGIVEPMEDFVKSRIR